LVKKNGAGCCKKIIKNQLEDVEATVWKDRNGGEASNVEVVIWAWDVAL